MGEEDAHIAEEADAEARRKAIVAAARRRVQGPAIALTVLGALQLAAGLAVCVVIAQGNLIAFAAGALWCGPGALVLLSSNLLRRLRGWNLVFSGLLFSVVTPMLVWGGLAFDGTPYSWLALLGSLASGGVLVFAARLEEDPEVRAARNMLYPPKPRDPADYQVL